MMRGDVVRNGLDVYKKARWNFLQLQGRLDSKEDWIQILEVGCL